MHAYDAYTVVRCKQKLCALCVFEIMAESNDHNVTTALTVLAESSLRSVDNVGDKDKENSGIGLLFCCRSNVVVDIILH